MSNFEKAFKKIIEEEGRKEMEKGRQQGIKQGVKQTIKSFLMQNVNDEIIINATGISKKELQQIKLRTIK